MKLPLAVATAVALLLSYTEAGTDDHRYKKGEHVELWVNKVRGFETAAFDPSTMRRATKIRCSVRRSKRYCAMDASC